MPLEALGHYIGNGANARAGEVIKGAVLDRDICEICLTDDAAGHGSIRKLDSAVDGHCAQLAEIDLLTALIPELQFSGHTGDIGVAGISPALAKVYADLASILVQTVHMGHIVHIGRTSPVKLSSLSMDGIGVSATGALLFEESCGNILTSAEIVVPSPLMEIVP